MATSQNDSPLTWFERFDDAARVRLEDLARVDRLLEPGAAGPTPPAVGEWIIQLTDDAVENISRIPEVTSLLQANSDVVTFRLIEGLGSEGLVLMEVSGASHAEIVAALESIDAIEHFGLNQLIRGQEVLPSDTDFARGAMPGLDLIGMPAAWQQSIGSLSTVVGVLDTGIDLAHRDLYLNIWLNQGEIPPRFVAEDGTLLLQDIDDDGLITFYDLNHATRGSAAPFELTVAGFQNGPNKDFLNDTNGNGYIDALDILNDPLWADGRDTDGNGEVDDFFGLNLRGEGLPPNNPMDTQGHGTHVAGTIGAVGGNSSGVTGINWQVSLMPLRILDSSNQGDTGAALRALNYAKSMRERYQLADDGRVVQGANVRVLNNSWGQPGGFETSLESAITESGEAGILFVAASGNGNFLGQGIDNDRTPFYPGSYNAPNVIAVAASTLDDRLASFSNFGAQSVDIAAPGVGVRSTELGGGYGTRNGTSMATPHVAGAAALIQSALPFASVEEVRSAILTASDPRLVGKESVSAGGRLQAASALSADVFSPVARLTAKRDITEAGGTDTEFTVEFRHPVGIDVGTIGNGDFRITRQWGFEVDTLSTLKDVQSFDNGRRVEATYSVPAFGSSAFGGQWDPLDFGRYVISSIADEVKSIGGRGIRSESVGSFSVRIDDSSVIYVDSLEDVAGTKSLRDALAEANAAAPQLRTIILDQGTHRLSIAPVIDPNSTFPAPDSIEGALSSMASAEWSSEATGDLDVLGNVFIFGDRNDQTIIDAGGIDRVFKVHPGASLGLIRVTIQGGVAPSGQGGGGILTQGRLAVFETTIRNNRSQPTDNDASELGGGGIAAWDGELFVDRSWIDSNQSDIGAGIFLRGNVQASIRNSTISHQVGGGLHSIASTSVFVENATFSSNEGGEGAMFARPEGVVRNVPPPPSVQTSSDDDRFQVIGGVINSLVPEDVNGFSDVYLFDNSFNKFELISVSDSGGFADGPSDPTNVPLISGDGRFVVFESRASNLVVGDTNSSQDIFVRDRELGTIKRISVSSFGDQAVADSTLMSISNDATRILFTSRASNLDGLDFNDNVDLFLHDVTAGTTQRITDGDNEFFVFSGAAISGDGSVVAFSTNGQNIVGEDTNNVADVFILELDQGVPERVSVATDGTQANAPSVLPSISDDGRYIYFMSNATNLDPLNSLSGTGEYVRDRQSNETFLRSAPSDAASISASQVTIFDDRVIDQPIVSGRVALDNALLAVRNPQPLGDQVTRTNVVGPERFGVTLVSPLVAIANEPPVHELIIDNPAIDTGIRSGTPDQRGQSRGDRPDIGAVEAISGSFEAALYIDLNGNQRRDVNEPGVAGASIRAFLPGGFLAAQATTANDDPATLDVDEQGVFQFPGIPSAIYQFVLGLPPSFKLSQSAIEELRRTTEAADLSADGNLVAFSSVATNLVVGDRNAKQDIFVLDRPTNAVQRISRGIMGAEPDGDSRQPSISADGRYVAYTSKAANLAVSDDEGFDDVFIFDRLNAVTTRISIAFRDLLNSDDIGGDGNSHSPQVSPDGTFVTFVSSASNLSVNDANGNIEDVFVYDIANDEVALLSDFLIGGQGAFGASNEPVIGLARQTIAFTTSARDYQHRAAEGVQDSNAFSDVVYFRASPLGFIDPINIFGLLSRAADGGAGNGNSHSPSMDIFGNSVVFVSQATNLDVTDSNGVSDLFLRRNIGSPNEELVRLMPDRAQGIQADGPSHSPSISGDGRFVTFVSSASNWIAGQTNQRDSIYVYSVTDGRLRRLSETTTGESPNGPSSLPVFSPDGRFISFNTTATNLFASSTPQAGGTVIVPNPFIEPSASLEIRAGQQVEGLAFGLIPDPGSLSGRVFVDDVFANAQFDLGEAAVAGVDVFLDVNRNLRRDPNELRAVTNADGDYRFEEVPAFRDYVLVVAPPQGFEQVVAAGQSTAGIPVFLPAGGNLSELDLGIRPITSAGQSSDSAIRGRVLIDTNGNGVVDGGDSPASGRVVYMDAGTPGVRDFNDPQAVTGPDGVFEFTGLPATITPLRVILDETLEQVSPVGSLFDLQKFALQDREKREGNPQAVLAADFSGDGFSDVAVALAETNRLSIRINDGSGGFISRKIDLNLSELAGAGNRFLQPTSLVAGAFDADPRLDVALTGNFSSSVLILRNFDVTTGAFASVQLVTVGTAPLDLVAGQFGGDDAIDLVVLNQKDNQVQVLTNDGAGIFSAGPRISTGGVMPASIVAADFSGDGKLDVAVVHANISATNIAAGRLTLLTGNGNGGLELSPTSYTVQANPVEAAVGDFNSDDRPDIAVVNNRSNSISILLGQPDGTLRVQTATLGTTQGAVDIAVADIDNDGDEDILATKLQRREVAIFRNVSTDSVTGDVRFEPQENIGLGEFSFAERAPFAVANLDNDSSGPDGSGTVDIVAVPQNTDTLYVLKNTLVQGSRRAAVNGARSDIASGVDFLVRRAVLHPSFAFQSPPLPIAENSPEQSVAIVDVQKGRPTGPALRFSATQSNPDLLTAPTIAYADGSSEAALHYSPKPGANGTSVITVRLVDAGADGVFDSADDGVFEDSVTVVVLAAINPRPTRIVLEAQGEIFDMRGTVNQLLSTISEIDIRGVGSNQLILDAVKVAQVSPDQKLRVLAGDDDVVTFGTGWQVETPEIVEGVYTHILTASNAPVAGDQGEVQRGRLELRNALPLQNPLQAADADRDGAIQPLDALRVINQLRRSGGGLVVLPAGPSEIGSLYFDVSGDNNLTALDALRVINTLSRINRGGSAEGEALPQPVDFESFVAARAVPDSRQSSRAVWQENLSKSTPRQADGPSDRAALSRISAIDELMSTYEPNDEDEAGPPLTAFGSLTLLAP